MTFALTGVLLSSFMVNHFVNDNIKQMAQTASLINSVIDDEVINLYLEKGINERLQIEFTRRIQEMADNYGYMSSSNIYIIDVTKEPEGAVVVSYPPIRSDAINENLFKQGGNYYFNENQYKEALENDTVIVDKEDYHGLYKNTGTRWITIARKLETVKIKSTGGEPILMGVLVISRPLGNVNFARNTIIRYFLLAMCIGTLFSMAVATFFTKRITEPIEKLRTAANKVSTGQFGEKIDYFSNDDMGDLIKSFNAMIVSLEQQDIVKNDFIANVSHELRTPMTIIGGFVDGMLDGTVPQDKRDNYLKIVKDEVMRINNLVDNQLHIARLRQGKLELHPKSFDINEMLRREIIKNENIIEDKKIDIEVEFEHDRQNVYADEESINRVIINIFNNAIKFTPSEGKITLGTVRKKDVVEIYIKDTGIGINQEDHERVFEKYFKTDRSRGVDKKGTGLGLSICKDIINAHNYNIKVENNAEGRGARFVFWLEAV